MEGGGPSVDYGNPLSRVLLRLLAGFAAPFRDVPEEESTEAQRQSIASDHDQIHDA